ncbi:MAG: hypothetical protein R2742_09895 [Micropruina glycogenica]
MNLVAGEGGLMVDDVVQHRLAGGGQRDRLDDQIRIAARVDVAA